jgi:HD-like signal output (HDOD) protein
LDDEQAILASLRSLLRHESYRLHLFSAGEQALAFLRQNSVDVIVSDLRMPEMSGVDFLIQAAAVCPEAVRIMLSGFEDKSIVVNALTRGLAQHYLLKPWDDKGLKELISESIRLQKELRKQQLKVLLNQFVSLPSPPRFHEHLKAMLSEPENSLKDLVLEIEKSPPLVAKLLRVANSVYYGTRKDVSSVRDAVIFIGTDYIASLVMAIETFQSVAKGIDERSLHMVERLWDEALHRAAISKAIGERWPGLKDPNLPFVASLLQDIGYVVRLCTEPEQYKRMLELTSTLGISKYEADIRVFVIAHDQVGAALLQFWNFPQQIVDAIAKHHRRTGDDVLAQIVQLAEALEGGDEEVPHDPAIDALVPEWREKLQMDVSVPS